MIIHDSLCFHNVAELLAAPSVVLHLSCLPVKTGKPLDFTRVVHVITLSRPTFHKSVNATGRLIETVAISLGAGGCCYIKDQFLDLITASEGCDFVSFAPGINILNTDRDTAPFNEKVAHLLNTVTTRHPEPFACMHLGLAPGAVMKSFLAKN